MVEWQINDKLMYDNLIYEDFWYLNNVIEKDVDMDFMMQEKD